MAIDKKSELTNSMISATKPISDKIGEATDSKDTNTVFGKMQSMINTLTDSVNGLTNDITNLKREMNGESTPYGTGSMGAVVYNPNTFRWGNIDQFNRYVLQVESLSIPAGVTFTPPNKCDGVYVYSQGDVIINGIIDLRNKKKSVDGTTSLLPHITIDGVQYKLAVGGDTVNGGSGGAGGILSGNSIPDSNDNINTLYKNGGSGFIINASRPSIKGNICGGGSGYYGLGGTEAFGKYNSNSGNGLSWYITGTNGTNGTVALASNASTALVIVASGSVILNGEIIGDASPGIPATNGSDAYETGVQYQGSSGDGGNGAQPPSGGSPITIICKTFSVSSGKISTKGQTFTTPDGSNGTITEYASAWTRKIKIESTATGGKGGSFSSSAGEIRIYQAGGAN